MRRLRVKKQALAVGLPVLREGLLEPPLQKGMALRLGYPGLDWTGADWAVLRLGCWTGWPETGLGLAWTGLGLAGTGTGPGLAWTAWDWPGTALALPWDWPGAALKLLEADRGGFEPPGRGSERRAGGLG